MWKKILLFVVCVGLVGTSFAAIITQAQARRAVDNWLARDAEVMGCALGNAVTNTVTVATSDGTARLYVSYLNGGGFVVTSADDAIEPILAFSSDDVLDTRTDNPLWALLDRDVSARTRAVQTAAAVTVSSVNAGTTTAKQKWASLLSSLTTRASGLSSISDVRVEPMVSSRWNQMTVNTGTCYNYYTPKNYPCGCVATAGSQIMRFHRWPRTTVTPGTYACKVDGASQDLTMQGGTYDWDNMPFVPTSANATQRQAIGKLTSDLGIACNMEYTSSSSGAVTTRLQDAFKNRFQYANAVGLSAGVDLSGYMDILKCSILTSLDAGSPVVLSITGSAGGHAIVNDGYGYNGGSLYLHVNLGWSGSYDAWYNPPNIHDFNTLRGMVYNIFPDKTGAVISGRLLSSTGSPAGGCYVVIKRAGVYVTQTITNSKGVYAVVVPPGTYTVSATTSTHTASTTATVYQSTSSLAGNKQCDDLMLTPKPISRTTSATLGVSTTWRTAPWTTAISDWMAGDIIATVTATNAVTLTLDTPVSIVSLATCATQLLTLTASGANTLTCQTVDDSQSTARTILNFDTGVAEVIAGVDTVLPVAATGTLTVATSAHATVQAGWRGTVVNNGTAELALANALTDTAQFMGSGTVVKSGVARWTLTDCARLGENSLTVTGGEVLCQHDTHQTLANALTLAEGTRFTDASRWKYSQAFSRSLAGAGTLRLKVASTGGQTDGDREVTVTGDTSAFSGTIEIEGSDALVETSAYRVKCILNPSSATCGKIRFVGVANGADVATASPRWAKLVLGRDVTLTGLDGLAGRVSAEADRILTIDTAGTSSFGGSIAAPIALVKTGAGTLSLNGANTPRSVRVVRGVLKLGVAGSLGDGAVTFENGTMLDVSARTNAVALALTVAAGDVMTVDMGSRVVASGARIIAWQTPPEGKIVVTGERAHRAIVASDGLYVASVVSETTRVISVNMAGGRNANTLSGAVSGEAEYGACPVAGKEWLNLQNLVNTQVGTAYDGVTVSTRGNNNYTVSGTNNGNANIFFSYIDDAGTPTVTIEGLMPTQGYATTCTVYVYMATDTADRKFYAPTVNGTRYTFVNGATMAGATDWGSSNSNRVSTTVAAVEGVNCLIISNVIVSATGTVTVSSGRVNTGVQRGGIAAVQIQIDYDASMATATTLSNDVAWQDALWTPTVTDWSAAAGMRVIVTNAVTPVTLTADTPIIAQSITTVATQPLTLAGTEVRTTIFDDSASSAKTTLACNTFAADVIAGANTTLTHAGMGTLTIDATRRATLVEGWQGTIALAGALYGGVSSVSFTPSAAFTLGADEGETLTVASGTSAPYAMTIAGRGTVKLMEASTRTTGDVIIAPDATLDVTTPSARLFSTAYVSAPRVFISGRLNVANYEYGGSLGCLRTNGNAAEVVVLDGGTLNITRSAENVQRATVVRVTGGTVVIDMGEVVSFVGNSNGNAFTTQGGTLTIACVGDCALRGVNGIITGSAAVAKTGSGMLTLAGTNTFSGDLTIYEGTLTIHAATAVGTGRMRCADGVTVNLATATQPVALALDVAAEATVCIDITGRTVTLGETLIAWEVMPEGSFTLRGASDYTLTKTAEGLVVSAPVFEQKTLAITFALGNAGAGEMTHNTLATPRGTYNVLAGSTIADSAITFAPETLMLTDNATSPWGIATTAWSVGAGGMVTSLLGDTPFLNAFFPTNVLVGPVYGGCVQQGTGTDQGSASSLRVTGLSPGAPYAVSLFIARQNAWATSARTSFAWASGVTNVTTTLNAASTGAGVTLQADGNGFSCDARNTNWTCVTFRFTALADVVTLASTGGSNIGAMTVTQAPGAPIPTATAVTLDQNVAWHAAPWSPAIDDWTGGYLAVAISNITAATVLTADTPVAVRTMTTCATQPLVITGDAITCMHVDDRASTASTTLHYATGPATITAGADTRLTHAGTGALTIDVACSITVPDTWSTGGYSGAGRFVLDAPGAVLAAAPRQANFTGTFVVTNGTVVYSATGVYPLTSSVEVCGPGAMLLFTNALDISGYETPNTNKRLTLRDGGTLRLAMRDTFSCPMILDNGGRVMMNADVLNANRAFDFFTGSSLRATGVATNVIVGGFIAIRQNNFMITVDEGATLDVQAQWGADSADDSLGSTWTKAGAGTVIFHRVSPQTGAVTIAAGTVRLEADATLCNATATFANGTTFDLSAKSTPVAQAMNVAADAVVTIAVYGRGVAAGDRLITWNTAPEGRFVLRGAPGYTVRKTATGLVVIPQGLSLILR